MPLFQQSVVNKYLNDINKNDLQIAWQTFTAHFHNRVMQENIRNLKEEEYQEGFVRDLFVTVLGYSPRHTDSSSFLFECTTDYGGTAFSNAAGRETQAAGGTSFGTPATAKIVSCATNHGRGLAIILAETLEVSIVYT